MLHCFMERMPIASFTQARTAFLRTTQKLAIKKGEMVVLGEARDQALGETANDATSTGVTATTTPDSLEPK